MRKIQQTLFVTLLTLGLTACGGGGSDPEQKTPIEPPPPQNQSPVANAGEDVTIEEGQSVTLTSSSTDADGSISTYAWTQTSGPDTNLSETSSEQLTFEAPDVTQDETAVFTLTVTDDDGASSTDTVQVTITFVNSSPTITMASPAVTLYPFVETVISFSISDPDNNLTQAPTVTSTTAALEVISSDNDSATVKLNDQPTNLSPIPITISVTDEQGANTTVTENVDVKINLQISNIEIDGGRKDAGCAVTALGFDCWYNPDDQYAPSHIKQASEAFGGREDIVNFYIMRDREVCVITDTGNIECVIGRYSGGDKLLSSQIENIPQYEYTDIFFPDEIKFSMFLSHPNGVVTLFERDNSDIWVSEIQSDIKIKKIAYANLSPAGAVDFILLMEDNTLYCSENSSMTPTPCAQFEGLTVLDATRIRSTLLIQTNTRASFVFIEPVENDNKEYFEAQLNEYLDTYFAGATFIFEKRNPFYYYDAYGRGVYFEQDGQRNRLFARRIDDCTYPYRSKDGFNRNCEILDGETGIEYNYPFKAVVSHAKWSSATSNCEISFDDRLVCYHKDGSPLYVPDHLKDHNF